MGFTFIENFKKLIITAGYISALRKILFANMTREIMTNIKKSTAYAVLHTEFSFESAHEEETASNVAADEELFEKSNENISFTPS